jgi:hypothetical protein
VLENRLLGGILELKRDSVLGGWRTSHDEELHNFQSSPNIILIILWIIRGFGHVTGMNEMRTA